MQNQTGGALYKGTLDCVTKTVKNEVGINCFLIIRIFAASILIFIRTKQVMKTRISKFIIVNSTGLTRPLVFPSLHYHHEFRCYFFIWLKHAKLNRYATNAKVLLLQGFFALYKGMAAPLVGVVPIFAVNFLGYSHGKSLQLMNNPQQTLS